MHRTDLNFARFLTLFKKMQSEDAVKIRITHPKEAAEEVMIIFFPDRVSSELKSEYQDLKKDLGLNPEKDSFAVVRDTLENDPNKLRIEGRSLLQVLTALATGVEIPPEHEKLGKAPPMQPIPEGKVA